jgi:hypothetical protein
VNRSVTLSLKENWKAFWESSSQRLLMLTGSVVVAIILSGMPFFFQHIEQRHGVQLHDLVLARIPAVNVSLYIFMVIWGMGLLTLIRAIQKPAIFVKYVWLYSAICITRMLTITLLPLEAPAGLVELVDPLTGVFYGHATITKDLFFSGHVSTLLAMYFCLERRTDRALAVVASIVVGVLLLIQHVHYTVDVLAAPIFVFIIHRIVKTTLFNETNGQRKAS